MSANDVLQDIQICLNDINMYSNPYCHTIKLKLYYDLFTLICKNKKILPKEYIDVAKMKLADMNKNMTTNDKEVINLGYFMKLLN